MFFPNISNEFFRGDAFFFSAQHDRGAMCVISANVMHLVTTHSLKANPNIGLYVFHQMADMDLTIGIRQCGGNKKAALRTAHVIRT